jgi:hypothetical protein
VQIENISQQAVREALATQSEGGDGKETEVVVEEVESAIGATHKVLEQLDIPTNPVVEPSLSGETSPAAYNVLFKIWQMRKGMQIMKLRHSDSQY